MIFSTLMRLIIKHILTPGLLLSIACMISTCKKSKISPCCWGELVNAKIYNVGCDYGMVRIQRDNGSYDYVLWDGDIKLETLPKSFVPASGDSIEVKIKYKTKKNDLCVTDMSPCTPCTVIKIKCIQKK